MPSQNKPDVGARETSSKRIPIRRRDILILVGFWVAGCAVVALLIGLFYANSSPQTVTQPEPVATYTVQFTADTAKSAYVQALAKGQDWSDDVKLVALSTRWNNATIDVLGQANSWDFRFYSPGRERIYFVVITPEDKILGQAHFKKLRQSPYLVNPSEWEIDSDEALGIWLNNGGGPFLEAYPENQVEIMLRQTNRGPVWEVIGISADQSQLFYVPISATSGVILN